MATNAGYINDEGGSEIDRQKATSSHNVYERDDNFETISLSSIGEYKAEKEEQQDEEKFRKRKTIFDFDYDSVSTGPPSPNLDPRMGTRGSLEIPHLLVTPGDAGSYNQSALSDVSSVSWDLDDSFYYHRSTPQFPTPPVTPTLNCKKSMHNESGRFATSHHQVSGINEGLQGVVTSSGVSNEGFVPIIISAKDLEAAFFSNTPQTNGLGGGVSFLQNTVSRDDTIQRKKTLWKDQKEKESGKKKNKGRLSIVGIHWPPKRRVWCYSSRVFVYNLLQRPKGWAYVYHVFVVLLIIMSLILTVFVTVPGLCYYSSIVLKIVDLIIIAILIIEFIARSWSCQCISKYQGFFGFLRFLVSPFRIIDMIVLASSALIIWSDWSGATKEDSLYWLRLLHVFQALRFESRFQSWRIISQVLHAQKEHLIIVCYMSFLSFLVISFVVYLTERNFPDTTFTSLAASMWWAMITLFTIGYGDMAPTSTAGQIAASFLIIFGCTIFALPAGFIGTGLALKVDEKNRTRHVQKRHKPAALLIQAAWRVYAGSEESVSLATWRINPIQPAISTTNLFKNYYHRSISGNSYGSKRQSTAPPQAPPSTPSNRVLTGKQKNCVRFIRKLKLLLAVKNFKAASRPYDLNDVLDQYSAGHADVIGRVRRMKAQITTVEYDIARTLQTVKNIQSQHRFQMARLETAIEALGQRISFASNVNSSHANQAPQSPRNQLLITPSFSMANLVNTSPDHEQLSHASQSEQYLQIFVSERNLSSISPQLTMKLNTAEKRKKKTTFNDSSSPIEVPRAEAFIAESIAQRIRRNSG